MNNQGTSGTADHGARTVADELDQHRHHLRCADDRWQFIPLPSGSTLTSLGSAITTGDTLTVNGKNITFVNTGNGNSSISANGATIDLASATINNVLTAIDTITGTGAASTVSGGEITLNTGTSSDLTLAGTALTKLGLVSGTTARTGLTLDIAAEYRQWYRHQPHLWKRLRAADIDAKPAQHRAGREQFAGHHQRLTGTINIVTSNNAASSTIGAITGHIHCKRRVLSTA